MPLERSRGISLIDVTDRVLDKGIVIDYWARVSLLGIDLLTRIEARIIVASIDTYVEYADRIGRTGSLAQRLSPGALDVG
jgi:gas vesicle structural protein